MIFVSSSALPGSEGVAMTSQSLRVSSWRLSSADIVSLSYFTDSLARRAMASAYC
jgi:hypothetical protein